MFRIWKAFKIKFNVQTTVRVPVRRAPPIPGAEIQHTHRFSWNTIWGDLSLKQGAKKEQPKDIMIVNAVNPTNFKNSLPSHSSVVYNSIKSNSFKSGIQSHINENCEPTLKFSSKLSTIRENSLKTNK